MLRRQILALAGLLTLAGSVTSGVSAGEPGRVMWTLADGVLWNSADGGATTNWAWSVASSKGTLTFKGVLARGGAAIDFAAPEFAAAVPSVTTLAGKVGVTNFPGVTEVALPPTLAGVGDGLFGQAAELKELTAAVAGDLRLGSRCFDGAGITNLVLTAAGVLTGGSAALAGAARLRTLTVNAEGLDLSGANKFLSADTELKDVWWNCPAPTGLPAGDTVNNTLFHLISANTVVNHVCAEHLDTWLKVGGLVGTLSEDVKTPTPAVLWTGCADAQATYAGKYAQFIVVAGGDDPPPGAGPELSAIFQTGMVLQRDRRVRVWGRGAVGETVVVSFGGQAATSAEIGEDGGWEATFAEPFAACTAGRELVAAYARGGGETAVDDVLVGDVWIAAGQSNMVMPLTGSKYGDTYGGAETVADIPNYPTIRVRHLGSVRGKAESYRVGGEPWGPATRQTSAVAYHFARELVRAHPEVPVGLVISAQNAQSIGMWDPTRPEGENLWNTTLCPIVRLAVRGAIWYQGEANKGNAAEKYRASLAALIGNWRAAFGATPADFPFYYVQLAGYGDAEGAAEDPSGDADPTYRTVREGMFRAVGDVANVGMAVVWDVGRHADDEVAEHWVHPRCKNIVGERLARLARRGVFGDAVVASSPYWTNTVARGDGTIRVNFDLNGSAGLCTAAKASTDANAPTNTPGAKVVGFAVAGEDRVWAWAKARVESPGTAVLWSPAVAAPRYVRYCARCNPIDGQANLYNEEMLPVAPVMTDDDCYAGARIVDPTPVEPWDIAFGGGGGIRAFTVGGRKCVEFGPLAVAAGGLCIGLRAERVVGADAAVKLVCMTDLTSGQTFELPAALTSDPGEEEGLLRVQAERSRYPRLFILAVAPDGGEAPAGHN